MATNYLEIAEQLKSFVTEFRNKANVCRIRADEAKKEANKFEERAVNLDELGETDEAQSCRVQQNECIQINKSLINNANEREELANKWEKLANDILNLSSEVLEDINKLEKFMQQNCDKNDCGEIRQLIHNRLLQEFTRYQKLLEFCRD